MTPSPIDPIAVESVQRLLPKGRESGLHARIKLQIRDIINSATALIGFDDALNRINLLTGEDAENMPESRLNHRVTDAALEVTWPHIHRECDAQSYLNLYGKLPEFIFDIGVFNGLNLVGGIEICLSHPVGRDKAINVMRAGLWLVEIPFNHMKQRHHNEETMRTIFPCMRVNIP